jgi:hypothetical protein
MKSQVIVDLAFANHNLGETAPRGYNYIAVLLLGIRAALAWIAAALVRIAAALA